MYVDADKIPAVVGLRAPDVWNGWLAEQINPLLEAKGWEVLSWNSQVDVGALQFAQAQVRKQGTAEAEQTVAFVWDSMVFDEETLADLTVPLLALNDLVEKWRARGYTRNPVFLMDKADLEVVVPEDAFGKMSRYPTIPWALPGGVEVPQQGIPEEYRADMLSWLTTVFLDAWKQSTPGEGVEVRAYVRKWPDNRVALAALEIERSSTARPVVMSWEDNWKEPGQRESVTELRGEDGSVVVEQLWYSQAPSETPQHEDNFFGTEEEEKTQDSVEPVVAQLQPYVGKELLTAAEVIQRAGDSGEYFFAQDRRTGSYIGDSGEKLRQRFKTDPELKNNAILIYGVSGHDSRASLDDEMKSALGSALSLFPNTQAPITILVRGGQEFHFDTNKQLIPDKTFTLSTFPAFVSNPAFIEEHNVRWAVVSAEINGSRRYTIITAANSRHLSRMVPEGMDVRIEGVINYSSEPGLYSQSISRTFARHEHLQQLDKIRMIGAEGLDAMVVPATQHILVGESGKPIVDSDLEGAAVPKLFDVVRETGQPHVVVRAASGNMRLLPIELLRLAKPEDYEVVLVIPDYADVEDTDDAINAMEEQANRLVALKEVPVGSTLQMRVLTPNDFDEREQTLERPGRFVDPNASGENAEQGANNFFIEVGNGALAKRSIATVGRNAEGQWSWQPIENLQDAYEDPREIEEQLLSLKQASAVEQTVDAIDRIVGTSAVPFRLAFRSGFRELGESKLEGRTVVAGIDAQAVQSSGLLALILYHEKIGHGLGQYWNPDSLPQAIGAELKALRNELIQEGDLEVFSEVLAQMLSTDLFVNGLAPPTKAEVYAFLVSGANSVDFGGKAFTYLQSVDTRGRPRTKAEVLTLTAKFVQDNYFQNHPDKARIDKVLAQMQSQPDRWLRRIDRAEKILRDLLRDSVQARAGPLKQIIDQSLSSNNLAAQAILRYSLDAPVKQGATRPMEKGLIALRSAIRKSANTEVEVVKIPSSPESLLARAHAVGETVVELEVNREGSITYVIGTFAAIEAYLREHQMTTLSQYRIRFITHVGSSRSLKPATNRRLNAIRPEGQDYVPVASSRVPPYELDVNGNFDPVRDGVTLAGFADQAETSATLWRRAEAVGGPVALFVVSEKGSHELFLSVVRIRDLATVNRERYHLTPVAIAVSRNPDDSANDSASKKVTDRLVEYGLLDLSTAGVDVFETRDKVVRRGQPGGWAVSGRIFTPAEFTTPPDKQVFIREAKKRLDPSLRYGGMMLLMSDTGSHWLSTNNLSAAKNRSFTRVFLYLNENSFGNASGFVRDFLTKYNISVATNRVEVFRGSKQRFMGKDGVSFENGERVLVRENGLEADPQVLLDNAERLGFQILQATRKSDGRAVWIVGILDDWLRGYLTETDYDIDRITQSKGNLRFAATFFHEVVPEQAVSFVSREGDGYRLGVLGLNARGSFVHVPLISLEYNQYGVRTTEVSAVPPQPKVATGNALSRFWEHAAQQKDMATTVFRNDLSLEVEIDVHQAKPDRPNVVPIPINNPQSDQAAFASSLVQLVEDGIASLDSVQVQSIDIFTTGTEDVVTEMIVGLQGRGEKEGRAGILAIRWRTPREVSELIVDNVNTTEKARTFFANIPAEQIVHAGARLGPEEVYSALGTQPGVAVEFLLAGQVYIVLRVDAGAGFSPTRDFGVPYSVVGGAANGSTDNRRDLLNFLKTKMQPGNAPVFVAAQGVGQQEDLPSVTTFQLMDGALHVIGEREVGSEVSALRGLTVNNTLYETVPTEAELAQISRQVNDHLLLVYIDDGASDGRLGLFLTKDRDLLHRSLGRQLQSRVVVQVRRPKAELVPVPVPTQFGDEKLGFTMAVTPTTFRLSVYSLPGSKLAFEPESSAQWLWQRSGEKPGAKGSVFTKDGEQWGRDDSGTYVDPGAVPPAVGLRPPDGWEAWLEQEVYPLLDAKGWKVLSSIAKVDVGALQYAHLDVEKQSDPSVKQTVVLFWDAMVFDPDVFAEQAALSLSLRDMATKWREKGYTNAPEISTSKTNSASIVPRDLMGKIDNYSVLPWELLGGANTLQDEISEEYRQDVLGWIHTVFIQEWKKSISRDQVFVRAYVRSWPDGRVALAAVEIERASNYDTIIMNWEEHWKGPDKRESLEALRGQDGSVITEHVWYAEEAPEIPADEQEFFGTDEEEVPAAPRVMQEYRGSERLTPDQVRALAGSENAYYFVRDVRTDTYIGGTLLDTFRFVYHEDPDLQRNTELVYVVAGNDNISLSTRSSKVVADAQRTFRKTKAPIHVLSRGETRVFLEHVWAGHPRVDISSVGISHRI